MTRSTSCGDLAAARQGGRAAGVGQLSVAARFRSAGVPTSPNARGASPPRPRLGDASRLQRSQSASAAPPVRDPSPQTVCSAARGRGRGPAGPAPPATARSRCGAAGRPCTTAGPPGRSASPSAPPAAACPPPAAAAARPAAPPPRPAAPGTVGPARATAAPASPWPLSRPEAGQSSLRRARRAARRRRRGGGQAEGQPQTPGLARAFLSAPRAPSDTSNGRRSALPPDPHLSDRRQRPRRAVSESLSFSFFLLASRPAARPPRRARPAAPQARSLLPARGRAAPPHR